MGDYRSRSYNGGKQIESYYGYSRPNPNPRDFRSYSANSYASPYAPPPQTHMKDLKLKKGKSIGGGTSSKSWGFNDAEFQRKKRVASYKIYSVEGKVKGSFRKSFGWIKERYTRVIYGWW